jgi:hypothetical protein
VRFPFPAPTLAAISLDAGSRAELAVWCSSLPAARLGRPSRPPPCVEVLRARLLDLARDALAERLRLVLVRPVLGFKAAGSAVRQEDLVGALLRRATTLVGNAKALDKFGAEARAHRPRPPTRPGAQEGRNRLVERSRRPDSNRGPLHYEAGATW